MRNFLIIISFLAGLHCKTAEGQKLFISAGSGFGNFYMKDLKQLNKDFLMTLPVRAKIVNDFPYYPYLNLKFNYRYNKIGTGIAYTHYSSGSRIHYADYSGSISVKQMVMGNAWGLPFDVGLGNTNRIRFCFEPGMVITTLKINNLSMGTSEQNFYFKSRAIYTTLGFSYDIRISKIIIQPSLGYFIDYGGKLFLDDDGKFYLEDFDKKPIHASFSGLRLNATIGFQLQ